MSYSETTMSTCNSSEDFTNDEDLLSFFSRKLTPKQQSDIFKNFSSSLLDFLEICDKESLKIFTSYNKVFFLTYLKLNVCDRLCLVFNAKLAYILDINFIMYIRNYRSFYPNPFYLKNIDRDFMDTRIRLFRTVWWVGEKYYAKKTKDPFFEDEEILNIFRDFNILLMEKKILNKRL